MKIVVAGLGRMGSQIARKLLADGHQVLVHNRTASVMDPFIEMGATPLYSKEEVVVHISDGERIAVWVMVPSDVVDTELDAWASVLPADSILIDGGNSDYRNDEARGARAKDYSVSLLDIGTSGGVWGEERGFCMMVGGAKDSFEYIEPVLKTLAAPSGAYDYFGGNGAGHYVKMVHNAIEYGMMQSIAEGYRMLKEGPIEGIPLAKAGEVWQHGSVVTSWLNELAAEAVAESPELDGISGVVAESGETRWTLETAKDLDIELPAIQASFDVRLASQQGQVDYSTKLLAAMRNKFGGHDINGK